MPKILANDGMHPAGLEILEKRGIEVSTTHIPQDQLKNELQKFDGILVRSATKVREDLIDACPNLKLIGRGGVGMDNIDVSYARSKGIEVVNTPAASSQSVAELVFAHLFTGARFMHESNRLMPGIGNNEFNGLKKKFSKGIELRGKNLGIIGFGRIGQAVAKIGLGIGMHVLPFDLGNKDVKIEIDFFKIKDASVSIVIRCDPLEKILDNSDFITIHVPFPPGEDPILSEQKINMMKDGVGIVNTSRGGAIVEKDLLEALDSGKVAFAGLDVYENEPFPSKEILEHPKISLTPHIGASTVEAQIRIWIEMAEQVANFFENEVLYAS